jgi:vacuolar-type H+-ATPase subunit H
MLALVDQLEELLERGVRVPLTGKVLLDEAELRALIEEMRAAVPDEVRLGQRIASERERILADARAQARRILEEAQAQVNSRLDEHGVVQAARQRAREIQNEAERNAARLRADANRYVIDQLSALEARLQRLLREVQAGQRVLAQENEAQAEGGGF